MVMIRPLVPHALLHIPALILAPTPQDINAAMLDLDKDGSGDIDFNEFWEW